MTNPFEDPQRAARYEDWYAGPGLYADRLEKRLFRNLLNDIPLARTALDVGCGTGHFTRWLADQGLRVKGLDISEPMLAEAKRRGAAHFAKGDATALPFHDSAFDSYLKGQGDEAARFLAKSEPSGGWHHERSGYLPGVWSGSFR